ncbi:MAG TPA: deoxyribose-phosphate aldolase [Bosea sp. (in: a-proteobacteria)]|jgi:deoxyribose-phosphate aldolase|uniref:deoxyribose-phosphate aldolase n=1 Tax=Bosea sp. (in: a-proteobacteria) TaxID=1871050 RepID=UPI002DDCB1F1|nr:deoxyribose-phosphate aldolase [Bosea sp. (in: a-proteobacteria)]HEV2556543.1 deoxyribose-phosphate aldolase [Bosea sp. (in: a-proteobacteria)]
MPASTLATARHALALLDLTDLSDNADEAGLAALCTRAIGAPGPVAAICIWPRFVAQARTMLGRAPVRIATVVNFPQGEATGAEVLAETQGAVAAGADEIDLVLPWRAFLAGDAAGAEAMVRAVREACEGRTLKVILETGEYPDLDRVRAASELAIAAGADFIKTSTGKTAHSASLPAARTMLEVIAASGRPVGLKPSGGIRTLADAAGYLELADAIMGPEWARPETFRFGASGLHQVLVDAIAGEASSGASGSY